MFHFIILVIFSVIFRIHSWGNTVAAAFEQSAIGMFGYMTDLTRVTISKQYDIEVSGQDMQNLLYKFLDEILFMFCAEPFMVAKVCFCFFQSHTFALISCL